VKECTSAGALRAYLDQELPDSEYQDVRMHLAACSECRASLEAMSQDVLRANSLLEILAPTEPIPSRTMRMVPASRALDGKSRSRLGLVAVLSGAMALALVLALMIFVRGRLSGPAVQAIHVQPPAPGAPTVTLGAEENHAAIHRRVRKVTQRSRPQVIGGPPFIPLDDDGPIEAGWIYRTETSAVLLPNMDLELAAANVPVDVLVDVTGRIRAYRLVQ
jgi:hypothetical protein